MQPHSAGKYSSNCGSPASHLKWKQGQYCYMQLLWFFQSQPFSTHKKAIRLLCIRIHIIPLASLRSRRCNVAKLVVQLLANACCWTSSITEETWWYCLSKILIALQLILLTSWAQCGLAELHQPQQLLTLLCKRSALLLQPHLILLALPYRRDYNILLLTDNLGLFPWMILAGFCSAVYFFTDMCVLSHIVVECCTFRQVQSWFAQTYID